MNTIGGNWGRMLGLYLDNAQKRRKKVHIFLGVGPPEIRACCDPAEAKEDPGDVIHIDPGAKSEPTVREMARALFQRWGHRQFQKKLSVEGCSWVAQRFRRRESGN